MTRIDGPSHRWLFNRVDKLDAAMAAALHATVEKLLPHLTMNAVVAAVQPEPPSDDFFSPPTTFSVPIDWQGLSVIQSLWLEQVAYNLLPQIYAAYEDAAVEQYDNIIIGKPEIEDALPGVTSTAAEEYMTQARNRMVGVGDKLWSTIRSELQVGVDKGESIDELKARLVASAGLSEPRARTVARTEVISAANAGSFDQARLGAEAGLVMEKEWLATEDFRTRPTHHAADGQKVGLEEPFLVGGSSLMFPGDPSGPADEIINCRCTLTYVVADDEPLAINASGAPHMATGSSAWTWDGLAHAEFCKSPLHPGPCKGAHGPAKKAAHKHLSKKVGGKHIPAKHAATKAGGGGGGGGGSEGNAGLTSQAAMGKTFAEPHKSGVAGLSASEKQKIYEDFKGHKGVSPAYSGKAIYESVQHAKGANAHHDLTDSDILSVVDEQGTKMGHTAKAGPSAYSDKVHAWLQTPSGKKVAAAHLKASQGHIPHEPDKKISLEEEIATHPILNDPHASVNEYNGAVSELAAKHGVTTAHVMSLQPDAPDESHAISLEHAVSSHGPGAPIIDDIKSSTIQPGSSDEEAYKHLAKLADKHGISVAEAGTLYDTTHGTAWSPQAKAHMKKYGLESGEDLPTSDEFDADISHLTAGHLKAVHDDFNEAYLLHPGGASPETMLLSAETVGNKYGLSPLQVAKAADAHVASHTGNANAHYTDTLLKHVGLESPPPPPPSVPKTPKVKVAKPKKLSAEELPKPSEVTGYKALPDAVKLDLGDSGVSHLSYEQRAAIVDDAKKAYVHAYVGEDLANAVTTVAEKHGVSKLQVAQVMDKYLDGKKKSWEKKTPNAVEKRLFASAKSSVASKNPLSTEGISAGNLAKLGDSSIDHIPAIQKQTVIDAAKTQYLSPYHADKQAYMTIQKLGSHLGFSPHQTAKILDEAQAGQGHLYEQKILKLAKMGTLPKAEAVYGSALSHGGFHLVEPPKNLTAKPGTHHSEISPTSAVEMQHKMNAQHGSWTPAQESALSTYTSSYYKHINGYLRSGGSQNNTASVKQTIKQLQSAMKPIPHDIILHRGADHKGFGLASASDLPSLVGKTYEDRGFLSTSVGGHAAFGGSVKLTIHAPKGTHGAYVGHGINSSTTGKPLSHFGHENEVILAAGTKYKVISATQTSKYSNSWDVVVEVVGDES